MNSKFQPSEDMFDEVEGHDKNSPLEPETVDAEAHGKNSSTASETDNVSDVESDEDEGTEGHGRVSVV